MLSFNFIRTQAGRAMPVVLAALLLTGCPGHAPQSPPPADVQGQAAGSSAYYLQQMQQSSDNNKADWQLLAVRAFLQEGKLPQAAQQLNTLPAELNDAQRLERQLLNAELLAAQNHTQAAIAALGSLDVNTLSDPQKQRYYQTLINASQGRPSLTLVRAMIAQETLLQGDARQKNLDLTWQTLNSLSAQDLSSLVIDASENTLRGWLDLLTTWQNNRQSPDQLKAAIEDWKVRYPHHPASTQLPTQLDQVINFRQTAVNSIALLLPLNGQAQVFANAIQQGFNAAKNGQATLNTPSIPAAPATTATPASAPVAVASSADAATAGGAEPAPAEYSASVAPVPASAPGLPASLPVKVYDTTTQPLPALLNQVQQDGASLIVGPLLKNEVEQIANSQTPINVLALNQPEHIQSSPNICYFALSPEDEARDAAAHIHQQSKQQPLLLVPRGALGDRVINAFADAWRRQGGGTLLQQRFGSAAELKQAINSGAGLSLSGQLVNPAPAQPAQNSVTVAGLTIPAQVEPSAAASVSGNVDAVYIIATPDELALIKPMIDMRTSSRSRPALYAGSRSFQSGLGPDFRLEMEGLQFSDIPLLAGANPALMQQVSSQFKNDYSLVRLYAMGMDAWTLASHFAEMRQLPDHQVDGATGTLSANQDCVIGRKLSWLQYRQGQVVPAS
ncbi:penicillin-binding protein activator [Affinibrenneria salicis]|uniref:Penicillin-binding protein activator LpoA n=1 Tax=Affinibrenneria salicis TaxID=2590031 RepID=A0A5J5FYG4_9GAMM|nr:penicillin-binding protein activator [Affinibrenneria salicis]KAA8999268.1 penicillin-binding protein activator [Affinibrenneria salicis]